MRFTINTTPLQSVLDLVVVSNNISKFYARSTVLQISVDKENQLKFNSEADSVISEAIMKGQIEGVVTSDSIAFVDAVLFKQLIDTFDSTTVSIEFKTDYITVYSGRSTFNVANLVAATDMQLKSPVEPVGEECDLNSDIWKLVKDKQLYALSDNFVRLVYTYIYNGSDKIITGDYIHSLFTLSKKGGLPSNCLLSTNIMNIILSVDSKSKIYHVGESFVIVDVNDAFKFTSELKPRYESDLALGSYNSDIIMDIFDNVGADGITIPLAKIKVLLSQTNILSEGDVPSIKWTCAKGKLKLLSDNVDGQIEGKLIGKSLNWELIFKLKIIIDVISNLEGENINIYPTFQEDVVNALIFKDESVSVILAGIQE